MALRPCCGSGVERLQVLVVKTSDSVKSGRSSRLPDCSPQVTMLYRVQKCSPSCQDRFPQLSSDSQNIPDILHGVAELAACHTGRKGVVADGDLLIYHGVGEAVVALGHGSHENTDALFGLQSLNVIATPDQLGVKTQGYLPAIWRQVVSNGVLNYAQKLLVGVGRAYG